MKRILVGVDESPNAAQALRWAVDHGSVRGQPVTAMLVWGYLDQHHPEPNQPFDPDYHEDNAQATLDELVRRAVGPDASVTCRLVCDLPARALLEASADASLLVVGDRGVGGFEGLLMGSVSRQVLHHATCPVVVVRSSDHPPVTERVVVGIDGSSHARRALVWAVAEGRARQVPVVAVNAWHYTYIGNAFYAPVVDIDLVQKSAVEVLDREIDAVDTTGLVAPIERRVVAASPAATALLDLADDKTLLVVGRRGLGGFKGLLLGSVSDQVTHHAQCPVVVIPPASR